MAQILEQLSELRVRRDSTATRSILRSAQCFVLALLAKKLCHLFVK
ncbi:MAG TPA: ribulose-phosphate 3-epimerase, partial [Deinococcus radiodurans]|nr:ribulose-phosphate 3-epimerase [Deinococcus radiodurans]